MRLNNWKVIGSCALLAQLFAASAMAVDLKEIERLLGSTGVDGWIHGSVSDRNLYVFTYRNPNDFFDYIQMSLVSFDPTILTQLASFNRNDEVLVKGSFMNNPSQQKHIQVTSISAVKKYDPAYPVPAYQYEARIPDELLNLSRATLLVHAVAAGGAILVVEYKDQVLPVFVGKPDLTKDLYRNDVVDVAIKIQHTPGRPTHLNIVDTDPAPVKMVDSIKALHGKPASVEGALILFPKSPEIITNVFAVQQTLPSGLTRQFTLANLDDPTIFTAIVAKLQKAWDAAPANSYVNGRNKRVSTVLKVKATGVFNEIDPSQANAQILLASPDDVTVSQ
jgi:hypothetical protein